jgi:hypothetical protein
VAKKHGIPAIRARMRELADEHGIDELNDLADALYRKSAVKRAKIKSPPLTPEMAEEIREYAKAHPDLHQQEIANHFGVNHGRVSEALNEIV